MWLCSLFLTKNIILYLIVMVIIKEVGDFLDIKIQRIDITDKISDILAGNVK